MVFQIDNKDFIPAIFTRFSHDYKIIELCNELYDRFDWDLISTNNNVDNEYILNYKQNTVDFIDTITIRVVVLKDYSYKRLPIIDFKNNELVSDTNQLINPTITYFMDSADKNNFVEKLGMTIDFLNILWNTINRKYDNVQWNDVDPCDPLSYDMKILVECYRLFPNWSHIGITLLHFHDCEALFQKVMMVQSDVLFLQRWFYTIDDVNNDNNEFKSNFTKAFNVDISEFEKIRQRLIYMYLLYLRYYTFISKIFYNNK